MEDIPRDLQKELADYKAPKKSRKARHWTLLFVGNQGEVITIRKFKGLMLLAIFIMIVALSAAVSIYMLYKKPFAENRRLETALSETAGQVRALAEERDLLLTRLGIAESKLTKARGPEPVAQPVVETSPPAGEPERPQMATPAPPVNQTAPTEPPASQKRPETSRAPDIAAELKPEVKVDVNNFQVSHDPVQNLLNVQFRLKNVNVDAGAVSGRTFVVMANDLDADTDVLTFPKVRLVDGKPGRIRLGRYFSISRFNIVKFKSVYKDQPRAFNRATVFVYSGAGDLLLEKNFPIVNPFREVPPAEPEPGSDLIENPEGANQNSKGPLPPNTILNN